MAIQLPEGNVTLNGTQTLTNKTLTSPTLTTPALGVATATSVAIGGATIGSNGLAVTGTVLLNTPLSVASGGTNTATGYAALASGSATNFMGGDLALNNTANFFDGPTSGSIGASGQVWLVMGSAFLTDTAGAAIGEIGIFNGTSYLTNTSVQIPAANSVVNAVTMIVVTLSAATTFTLRARDQTATTGVLKTSASASETGNRATSLTTIRIA